MGPILGPAVDELRLTLLKEERGNNLGTSLVAASMSGAGERISLEVGSWDGVESHDHRFGGVEFRLGRVELGHVHGDTLADLPFPRKTRDSLIDAGRAQPHHVLPDTGWVSRRIRSSSDVDDVIELFRLNYERVANRRAGHVH
jgi:hypothetical protein